MRNYVPDAEIVWLLGHQVFSRSNLNPSTSINEWLTSKPGVNFPIYELRRVATCKKSVLIKLIN